MHGYEKVWFIGDNFAHQSFERFMKGNKKEDGSYNTFTYQNFEVKGFFSYENSYERWAISRMRNALVTALNEHNSLPKLIVVIPDDDIIRDLRHVKSKMTKKLEKKTNWITRQMFRVISSYKDLLPQKAKRQSIPHVLWISPPTLRNFGEYNNENREKFTICLETAVDKQPNMSTLKLIKNWDYECCKSYNAKKGCTLPLEWKITGIQLTVPSDTGLLR